MLISVLIITVPILVVTSILMLILMLIKWRHNRFINPLIKSLRRPPGTSVGQQLVTEQLAVGTDLCTLLLLSIIPGLLLLLQPQLLEKWMTLVVFLLWTAWVIYTMVKIVKRAKRIRRLRLGYECELAVGQELDLLMLNGLRVFHDVQAESFNIDHIVVGAAGVFAVETKGRSKSWSSEGEKQYKVAYEDGVLFFPRGQDKKTVMQAKGQSEWVSDWLSQATGLRVPVQPVVVLPGWYIEKQGRPEIPVIAAGYIEGYFLGQKGQVFSDQQIEQIVYQIDQKVRDLAPGEVGRPGAHKS